MDAPPPNRDIHSILSSNAVPTALDAASVQDGIDDLTAHISQKRAELDALETQLTKHKAALSARRRLPPEVVSQIIRLVAWGVLHAPGRRTLVELSLVCRGWRRAALLCHEQWKGLHIEEGEVREPVAFDGIVSWYARSGNLPKILEFRVGGDADYCECLGDEEADRCKFTNPTLVRLLCEGPALDHFYLQVTKPSCLRNFLRAIGALDSASDGVPRPRPRPWDTLRSLKISFSGADFIPWDDAEHADGDSVFDHLPPVTSLSIHMPDSFSIFESSPETARSVRIHVPPSLLQNLTTFHLECDWEGNHIPRMLEHCVNVEKLTIDTAGKPVLPDITDAFYFQILRHRLSLPRLHTLHLESQNTLCVLDFITAPALRHISLDTVYTPRGEVLGFCGTFDRFVMASDCRDTLVSLEVRNALVDPKALAKSILALRGLKRLELGRIPSYLHQLLWVLEDSVTCAAQRAGRRGSVRRRYLEHLEELVLTRVPTHMGLGAIPDFVKALTEASTSSSTRRRRRCSLTITWDVEDPKALAEERIVEAVRGERGRTAVRVVPDGYLEWVYHGRW